MLMGESRKKKEQVDANLTRQDHIAPNQAIIAAAKNVSAQATDVRSVTLDNENDQLVFSVDITKANIQPVDVKVDTINGKVLRVDPSIDGEEENDESGPVNKVLNELESLSIE